MNDIERFLLEWNKADTPETFLETGVELPDAKTVQDYLDTLPAKEQDEKRNDLARILNSLEQHSQNLEKEMAATAKQMRDNQQASDACISYSKADKTGRNDDNV